MFTSHISRRIAAHIDGQLEQHSARQAEIHLRQCSRCQAEFEQVKQGMALVEQLPLVSAPEAMWSAIEAAFQEQHRRKTPVIEWLWQWRWVFAASVVLAVIGAAYFIHPQPNRWDVVRLGKASRIGAGEWIETDARSRATVMVGAIGSVELAPNTRVRVVTALPGEHRLALAKGEILAKISAPPKLFFVDTAAGTAVDLGCEYTLSTGEDGSGLLRVIKGWVAFQWNGLESLVPAGASCRIRPQTGPQVPYFDDAPDSLKHAVENYDLSAMLNESRARDTLTLWHLLWRVAGIDRERVFDRIATLTPVPAGVMREQALRLDPETLRRWKEELAWTW